MTPLIKKTNYLSAIKWSIAAFLAVPTVLFCTGCTDPEEAGNLKSAYNSTSSMNTGQNCISCHTSKSEGGAFTVAGTVYKAGGTTPFANCTVYIYSEPDGGGTLVYELAVDGKGNFYTTDAINFGGGLYPVVKSDDKLLTSYMGSAITSGSCNSCHSTSISRITVE
jgi:hypothetical protein